eukprot:c19829_g4_i2.p1 GENE.c19829_g4_i2~~c19829_g4_i2.p1  ORF type:complete len:356 (-),score=102.97 c19829_g4_i2:18-1034(-)
MKLFGGSKKKVESETGEGSGVKRRDTKNISDLYNVGKELGSGGFSVVKVGTCKTDKSEWALKLIQHTVYKKNKDQTEKEVEMLAMLDHPGVVKLREVVTTQRYFVIVMELLNGGELFDRIVSRDKYNENDAKVVAKTMLEILQYLHSHDIVHRDLKPENLVFNRPGDDAELKLTDFGFATPYSPKQKLTATCGTPEYVAPEILNEQPYGPAVDMWSAGVIIYILLCGFPPFYGDNDDELFERICSCNFKFLSPYWDRVSDEAKSLIRALLEVDPKKRLTADQALQHAWFGANSGSSAVHADLSGALSELRRYNATRKFRKGVLLILAANKLKVLIGDM